MRSPSRSPGVHGKHLGFLRGPWGCLETIENLEKRLCRTHYENNENGGPWGSKQSLSGPLGTSQGSIGTRLGGLGTGRVRPRTPWDASGLSRDVWGASKGALGGISRHPQLYPASAPFPASANCACPVPRVSQRTPQEPLGGVPPGRSKGHPRTPQAHGEPKGGPLRAQRACAKSAPLTSQGEAMASLA